MLKFKNNTIWLSLSVISCILSLIGCSSIEYRSEAIEKKPLATIQSQQQLKPKWKLKANSGIGFGKAQASTLNMVNYNNLLISTDYSGVIVAVDSDTGKIIWKKSLDNEVTAGPSLDEDTGCIYLAARNNKIYSLKSQNGDLKWETQLSGSITSLPTVSDSQIYVHMLDGTLTALNKLDGRQLWHYRQSPDQLVLRNSSSPIVTKNKVINGFSSGYLVALNKRDGTLDWRQKISIPKGRSEIGRMVDITGQPLLSDGKIYVTSYQGNLACVDEVTGKIEWSRELSNLNGLTISQDQILVADVNGVVWCLNKQYGNLIWQNSDFYGRKLTKPIVHNQKVIIADDDGRIHCLDYASGNRISEYKNINSGSIAQSPLVKDNNLYILNTKGQLSALEFENFG